MRDRLTVMPLLALLALLLLAFAFVTLSITYSLNRRVWAVWPMHR